MKNDGTACQQTVAKSGFKHDGDGSHGAGRKNCDEKYIERGAALILDAEEGKEAELKKANRHKNGHPLVYTESLIMSVALVRSMLGMPYRQLAGFVGAMLGPENVPSYGHLRERINRLDVKIVDNFVLASSKPGMIRLVVDSSGLRQHNCGSWIAKKWKTKRGFVKIHFLIDADTKKVLGLKVTDESVGDPTVFQEMFDDVLRMLGPVPKGFTDMEIEEKARIGAIRAAAQDDVDEVVTAAIREAAGDIKVEVAGAVASAGVEVAKGAASAGVEVAKGAASAGVEVAKGAASAGVEVAKGAASAGVEVAKGAASAGVEVAKGAASAGVEVAKGAASAGVEIAGATTVETANMKPRQNRMPSNPAAVRRTINKIAKEAVSDISHTPFVIVLGDRAYATRTIIEAVKKAGFVPGILFKKNAKDAGDDPDDPWDEQACDQLGAGEQNVASLPTEDKVANREEWKKLNGYGKRWIVEIVFASFKRMFGESVSSLTKEAIIQEVRIKVAIYNGLIDKEMARAC